MMSIMGVPGIVIEYFPVISLGKFGTGGFFLWALSTSSPLLSRRTNPPAESLI